MTNWLRKAEDSQYRISNFDCIIDNYETKGEIHFDIQIDHSFGGIEVYVLPRTLVANIIQKDQAGNENEVTQTFDIKDYSVTDEWFSKDNGPQIFPDKITLDTVNKTATLEVYK